MTYEGDSYLILNEVVGVNTVFYTFKYDSSSNSFVLQTTHTHANVNIPFVDGIAIGKEAIFTFGISKMVIIDVTDLTTEGFRLFEFINQPTMDFGDLNYSGFIFDVPDNATNADTIDVTVTGTNVVTLLIQEWVGGKFYSLGSNDEQATGEGKIKEVSDHTTYVVLVIEVKYPFEKGKYAGSAVVLQKPVFYADDQQPSIIGYFDSRLYVGRTKERPLLLCASRVNIINDFDVGDSSSDYGFCYQLDSEDGSSQLNHIIGHIGLFLMTDKNELVVIPSIEDGITPTSFIAQKLSDWGSSEVAPAIYSNFLLFVTRTNRKIIKIDSASSNSFSNMDITQAMDIQEDITSIGIIDDELIDIKLCMYATENTKQIKLISLYNNGFGRTTFDFLSPQSTQTLKNVFIGQVGNKSLLIGKNDLNEPITALFTNLSTGLTNLVEVSGTTVTFDVDTYIWNSTENTYIFVPANTQTNLPSGYDYAGDRTTVYIRSIPLVENNPTSWSYKWISYIFVSYYQSSRFFVNGKAVAFPTTQEISMNEAPLKTDFIRINITQNSNRFKYIEITTSQPYPLNLQAYGWAIETSIMV